MSDLIGVWVGAILTLLVFSYLLGDSPLFRIAQAILVGVTIGYAATVAIRSVLIPLLAAPLLTNPAGNWSLFVPLLLGLLLFAKLHPASSSLGNPSVALLFGVGGALAIGGALSGVLVPQLQAAVVSFAPAQEWNVIVDNFLLVIGTLGALLSFRFIVLPKQGFARGLDVIAQAWSVVGRWFILIAFGAIFADTAVSRVSILISRVYFLLHDWLNVVR